MNLEVQIYQKQTAETKQTFTRHKLSNYHIIVCFITVDTGSWIMNDNERRWHKKLGKCCFVFQGKWPALPYLTDDGANSYHRAINWPGLFYHASMLKAKLHNSNLLWSCCTLCYTVPQIKLSGGWTQTSVERGCFGSISWRDLPVRLGILCPLPSLSSLAL